MPYAEGLLIAEWHVEIALMSEIRHNYVMSCGIMYVVRKKERQPDDGTYGKVRG